MGIFSRKKSMTTIDLGNLVTEIYTVAVNYEFDQANKKGNESLTDEDGEEFFSYDRKKHADEKVNLFAFMIYNEVKRRFPRLANTIIQNFYKNLTKNDVGFVIETISEYKNAWEGKTFHDPSIKQSSNPIFRVSKLATKRRFENDIELPHIIMFTESFNYFTKVINENLKDIKAIG